MIFIKDIVTISLKGRKIQQFTCKVQKPFTKGKIDIDNVTYGINSIVYPKHY